MGIERSRLASSLLDLENLDLSPDVKVSVVDPEEFLEHYVDLLGHDNVLQENVKATTFHGISVGIVRVVPWGVSQRLLSAQVGLVSATARNGNGSKSSMPLIDIAPGTLPHNERPEMRLHRQLHGGRQFEAPKPKSRFLRVAQNIVNFVSERSEAAPYDQYYPASLPDVLDDRVRFKSGQFIVNRAAEDRIPTFTETDQVEYQLLAQD